jgi:hypothetical protein
MIMNRSSGQEPVPGDRGDVRQAAFAVNIVYSSYSTTYNMTYLIFGASGRSGIAIGKKAVRKGEKVVGVIRDPAQYVSIKTNWWRSAASYRLGDR